MSLETYSLSHALAASLKRELLLAVRQKSELFNPLLFFLVVVVFVPLGITPDKNFLAKLAPGMIWVFALLATLLSLESLFKADFEDGSLEQMLVSPLSLFWIVGVKVFCHWLLTGVPLTLLAPVLGVMLFLPHDAYLGLIVSLLIGTACLSLIGAIGAALTVSLRRGGLVLSLIVMPLYVPILIFGADTVNNLAQGLPYAFSLLVLGVFFFLALLGAPLASAGALRISVTA
ncbi:MAG TPA: heme exporter protein CcmB [Cellvibrionaceae bacterium]|nr:heme exporter protein CcmB [Cellvibrionaceae bacterium]HMY38964.1 heme exporter protein CcmB [Marinagarivorans sp.]